MLDLVCVGDVMLDVLLPAVPSPERPHGSITTRAGGSAVNAALAAAALGARACVVGAVGRDPAASIVEDTLEAAGIEARLERLEAPTGTCVYAGASVVADRGANLHFEVPALPPARATLVSGYLGSRVQAAVAAASGLVAVDTQGRPVDTSGAAIVLGSHASDDAGDGLVVSTLGPEGVRAGGFHVRPERVLPEPQVGAGDRFAAALLLALADGAPLEEALGRACAAAV